MKHYSGWSLIILAAGRGTRLGMPMPKPLVPLGGKPLIQPVIELGQALGFAKIVIVISEFTKEIMEHFQGPTIEYVMTEPRGTGDAALHALKAVTTPYFIMCGADDSYFYEPGMFEDLMGQHLRESSDLTLAYFTSRKPFRSEFLVHENGRLLEIRRTEEQMNVPPPKDVPAGLYAGTTEWIRADLPNLTQVASGEYEFPELNRRALDQGRTVSMFHVPEGQWHGINTPDDYEEAQRLVGGAA
jgi:bifunctional UDP-N-acetylglucosamine pyrophosphorylase / glucosamine-1-phosphate N-acetyltransferase